MKCPKESTLEDVKRKDGENNEKAMDEVSGRSFSDCSHGTGNGSEGSGKGNGWKNRGGVFVK